MRRTIATLAAAAILAGLAAGAAASASTAASPSTTMLTPAQLVARFKAKTKTVLVPDRRSSYPGHYAAFTLPQSISNIGRYGRFTIWVVTSGSAEDLVELLVDPHTGELGAPGAASIFWEHGSTLGGSEYWLAKKRYGANVVLWWYGNEHRVDAAFGRLHRPLLVITA
jgi:hypothetical protein